MINYGKIVFRTVFCYLLLLIIIKNGKTDGEKAHTLGYGPYKFKFYEVLSCKGPKAVNLTTSIAYLDGSTKDSENLIFNFTLSHPTSINTVKAVAYMIKENGASQKAYEYLVKDRPCRHWFLGIFLRQMTGNEDCILKPGTYSIVYEMGKLLKNIYGINSLYLHGKYSCKTIVLGKKGNISCLDIKLEITRL